MGEDLIAALSTPPGEGGIGIIRTSGSGVIERISQIFSPAKSGRLADKNGFTLTLGWITDKDGSKIDKVLIGIMRGPHSYTGEDVVEINCHGGSMPVRRCLQRCLDLGLRLAEPGEFTKRAFLNGRLDLSQAEAVIDVIRAKTDRGLHLAMQQLEGKSQFIEEIEDGLLHVNAMVDASLDFPEEVGDLDYDETRTNLVVILNRLDKLLAAGRRNEVFRDGVEVVICGKPNVGKSSLLNALLRQEKAIVTDTPGTTRDVVEDYINIRGIPVKIMDTAGIRVTEDFVEKMGVQKSREVMEKADLLIFMLDIAEGIDQEDMDIYNLVDPERVIVLVNKDDLEKKRISPLQLERLFAGVKVIRASIINEVGLEELEQAIEEKALSGAVPSDGLDIMVNLRQKDALERSREQVWHACQTMQQVPLDCFAIDIWGALETLGEINGKSLKEDVINRIFHEFCIGK
ncbi:MAG: tRNA uridine-5-carboxymethylaminomethyl(34) synthesis GTPase MnmE [Syntrophomonadaceae bacterium]|nr:tRNA uridine-5-carboxymethylaminomethyl(34) synthesis GTPase MnmE [Syntrophomonadaceae bacterium]